MKTGREFKSIVLVPGDENRVVTFERQCSFFTVALDMAAELQTGANKPNVTEGDCSHL